MLMSGQYQSIMIFCEGPIKVVHCKKKESLKCTQLIYRFCNKIWSLRVCNRYTYGYMPQNTYTKSSKCFEAWFTLKQDLHAIYTYSYWHLHAQHWPGSICVDIVRIHNGTHSTMVITSTVALFSTEMCLHMACPYHGPSTYMVGNYWGPITQVSLHYYIE
jgi:hypothetical protein